MASAFTLMAPAGASATIVAIRGEESVSSLFAIDLELTSAKQLAPESWLGQPVRVAVAASGRTDRYVAGICARFAETGRGGTYRATVVPSIWPLTKRATSRIFQEKSAVEILQTIFAGYGVAFALSGNYAKRAYCVQYRETDMQFAQRLMEDEGICFFFRQTKEGDQLVIADPPIAGVDVGSLAFATTASGAPIVYEWERAQELRAAKVTLRDYDFEKPRLDLTGQATAAGASAARLTEIYDYPAGVRELGALAARAKVRLEEEQGTAIVARGATSSAALVAGGKLVVTGVARRAP